MKRIAIVKFTLMFDPDADTWTSGEELENDLGRFLAVHGLEGQAIKVTGGSGERMFYIKRMDNFDKFREMGVTNNDQSGNPKKAFEKVMKKASKAGSK